MRTIRPIFYAIVTAAIATLAAGADPHTEPITDSMAADCYTTNCTGTDVRGRRTCYLCCADKCEGREEISCQESCDTKWVRTASDFIPQEFLELVVSTRLNADDQMDILTDIELWDWLVAGDEVNFHVVEIADWFFQNAADVRVERMAMVTLAWIHNEHEVGHEGQHLIRTVFLDALHSDDARVRRSAMVSLKDVGAHRTDQRILIDFIRVVAQEPDPAARQMGIDILADF